MADNEQPRAQSSSLTGGTWWAVFLFALLLTIGLAVFVAFLVLVADDEGTTENTWNRYVLLLGGAEAIVFAAIGWVFGREVYRHTADSARKQADQANEDAGAARQHAADAEARALANASEAAKEQARGRALYAAIAASSDGVPEPEFRGFALDDEGQQPPASHSAAQLRSLRSLAERLYGPDAEPASPEAPSEEPEAESEA